MKEILLIEDHKDTAELFDYAARSLGINPTVCDDGAQALNLLEAKEFDVVILDLSMPVLDGLTISQEIRKNEEIHPSKKPVCIIFYTARNIDRAILKVANEVGVMRIFQKPYDMTDMLAEIKDVCMEPEMIIRTQETKQNGHSSPNMIICLFAVILQIVVASLFLWLLNKQDVAAAYRYSEMRNQRDQYKTICESNLLLDLQKETWIRQQSLELPAQITGQKPCAATENKEEK